MYIFIIRGTHSVDRYLLIELLELLYYYLVIFQVLCDILMVQCMLPIRDEMLADIEGPSKMRLTNWYKVA